MDDGDGNATIGRIDLYKRCCFVLEAKQGSTSDDGPTLFATDNSSRGRRGTAVRGTAHWDAEMKKAKGQAERYVRSLPPDEGNPPFILVVDVGPIIEIYSDFSRLGKAYVPFPDTQSYRISMPKLADEQVRRRLVGIWTDPLSLDPARHSAKVTCQIAEKLATLARSFEAVGHHPELVASFLMRCLFTFFAEDVLLIERRADHPEEQPFTDLLKSLRSNLDQFIPMVQEVWARMDGGGFSTAIRRRLKHFNGKLFKECQALQVNREQLELLIEAGESDWSDVEPAIFGTLLERAIEPEERHKLGAHYTPRAYVERLVLPTVIEPLREKWDATKAAAFTLQFQGKNEEARKAIRDFLADLCNTTVLDPACGSANFLYVTMEHMKKLEGEAREELRQLGENQVLLERGGLTVDPHQFLGLEINPRAVAIAELVLWIGYLKWHLRTLGHAPAEPLLRAFDNIKQQDAVLAYEQKEIVTDESGKPLSRWDGRTMKISPVTGEEIPDETARAPICRYKSPRRAEWPKADYVVGNPPFIGGTRMRETLGDDYTEQLRATHSDVPASSDLVFYWWNHAAKLVSQGSLRQFGLISTNSIRQPLNRQVVSHHLSNGLSLAFAVPDHPWVDESASAAVRIAMTVGRPGVATGRLGRVIEEIPGEHETEVKIKELQGQISADLTIDPTLSATAPLKANRGIAIRGVCLVGEGFVTSRADALDLGLGRDVGVEGIIKPFRNGKDLTSRSRDLLVIDLQGLGIDEVRSAYPAIYQRIFDRVKPERDVNRDAARRRNWWVFGRAHTDLRGALKGLERYIATAMTAKHRVFAFLDASIMPDQGLIAIATSDATVLGVLSSRVHCAWALMVGGTLEDRPRYNNTVCFDPFPFPFCGETQNARIKRLGDSLDSHRKRQQELHPSITITGMYNVLEKLRDGTELTAKERVIHERGLVSVLKQIHDDLDEAVADAYGWPVNLSDEEIVRRLVALNGERVDEEKRGIVRWLRPDLQNPRGTATTQEKLELPAVVALAQTKGAVRHPWPKALPEQAQVIRTALGAETGPIAAADLARRFKGAKKQQISELLATLAALGQARLVGDDRYVA